MNKVVKMLDNEANKVTVLLNFLISNPSITDNIVSGDNMKKIETLNVIRVSFVKRWADEMMKEFERIYGKEFVDEITKPLNNAMQVNRV